MPSNLSNFDSALLIYITCMLLMSITAGVMVTYPLRHSFRMRWLALFFSMLFMLIAYVSWGSFSAWNGFRQLQRKHQQAEALLTSLGGTNTLIQQLKTKLAKTPNSAQGWYLLGKLYLSQQNGMQAKDAFYKAWQLNQNNEQYILYYAQSAWNKQKLAVDARHALKALLRREPNQADALAMLAVDAFNRHRYQQAIDYWQRLLHLMPEHSEEAVAIQQAIIKAKSAINTP